MPLAVEIVLIVIGVLLLALALIGSGISRRLMTIPKMHRAPRVAVAILGVLLLAGGFWGMWSGTQKHGPTLAALRAHIPNDVKSSLTCTQAVDTPKNGVKLECSGGQGSLPTYVWYAMFPDVNSMQNYWMQEAGPSNLPGTHCKTIADYETGGKQTFTLGDQAITDGDEACYVNGNTTAEIYTDRRYNIVVYAEESDPQKFSDFTKWLDNTSVPPGPSDTAPPTPSQTPDGS
ncbi:hypothetical protein ACH47Z_22875 [Streptomyces sp. NPDC020192]|uniref:hypothetical protein n=1 Tax=Streptomyces sp. NPDC020192 TaxID=3365066 RepID=UPI0037AFA62D